MSEISLEEDEELRHIKSLFWEECPETCQGQVLCHLLRDTVAAYGKGAERIFPEGFYAAITVPPCRFLLTFSLLWELLCYGSNEAALHSRCSEMKVYITASIPEDGQGFSAEMAFPAARERKALWEFVLETIRGMGFSVAFGKKQGLCLLELSGERTHAGALHLGAQAFVLLERRVALLYEILRLKS